MGLVDATAGWLAIATCVAWSCMPLEPPGAGPNRRATPAVSSAASVGREVARMGAEADAGASPVVDDPPLDPAHWVTALDSAAEPFLRPKPQCLKDLGCPYKTVTYPPCAAGVEAVAYKEDLDWASLAGKWVSIQGELRMYGPCTTLWCERPMCCNNCGGEMLLASPDTPPLGFYRRGVRFADRRKPWAFICFGDDSIRCCGLQVEVEVIAQGVLELRDRVPYDDVPYGVPHDDAPYLVRPRLCRPHG